MNQISGIIITLNEQTHIRDCIRSLKQICDEIIVVDSGSTDRTAQIAQQEGARVYSQKYLGDGRQKNYGLQYARNDWILSLDADERLTPEAIAAIKNLDLANTPFEAFSLRRRNYIGHRWIKVCGWYPDHFVRLYNRCKTQFAAINAHSRVTTKNFQRLEADLLHFSYRDCGELFSKAVRFSSRSAKVLYKNGRRARWFSPLLHGLNAFVRKYFWRRGCLGGVDGFTVALSAGVNSYLKYARLLEIQRDPAIRKKIDDAIW